MTWLGKTLVFLNVLAALAFAYMVQQAWNNRVQYAREHFRYLVAIDGLPVTTGKDQLWTPGDPIVLNADETTVLKDIFAGKSGGDDLGGSSVKTQVDEVKRLQQVIVDRISAANGDAGKRSKLASYMLNLARDGEERDRWATLIATVPIPGSVDEWAPLKEFLSTELPPVEVKDRTGIASTRPGIFAAALSDRPLFERNKPSRDQHDQRTAIAHLLVNISDDEAWRDRVQTVVGVAFYAQALDRQASVVERMVQRQRILIAVDQATFLPNYQALVQRALFLAEQIDGLTAKLKVQQALVEDATKLVNDRTEEKRKLAKELEETTAAANAELAKQAALEAELFRLQKQITTTQEANVVLERKLRVLEQGR
jgi:hypothetical protein